MGGSLSTFDKIADQLARYGQVYSSKTSLIFFGQSNFGQNEMMTQFKKVSLLNQVHGIHIIKDPSQVDVADGQYSEESQKALVIKTADCMPVFIEDSHQIIALHIGWRALMQKFLSASSQIIKSPSKARLWIGPHIQQSHFALDEISTEKLLDPHNLKINQALEQGIIKESTHQKNHFLVSLSRILLKEAHPLGLKNIEVSKVNTFTSFQHYSHRRNRHQVKRNLSFIVKK